MSDRQLPGLFLMILAVVAFWFFVFLIELDRSQLRDLQRRVAELEQKK